MGTFMPTDLNIVSLKNNETICYLIEFWKRHIFKKNATKKHYISIVVNGSGAK